MYLQKIAVSAALLIGAVSCFQETVQTLTGTVTDSMCGAKHMMTNVSPAQCIHECVKGGSEYALLTGGKVYALRGADKQMDKYAGKNVTVTGAVSGTRLKVRSISAGKP